MKLFKNLQLNIIKKIKKNYKRKLMKDVKIFLKNKRKKQQYGLERYKNFFRIRKNPLL